VDIEKLLRDLNIGLGGNSKKYEPVTALLSPC
jgi:hypothetical protein